MRAAYRCGQLGRGREALVGGDADRDRDRCALGVVAVVPVGHGQGQVGQRLAQGRQLPVQDGDDPGPVRGPGRRRCCPGGSRRARSSSRGRAAPARPARPPAGPGRAGRAVASAATARPTGAPAGRRSRRRGRSRSGPTASTSTACRRASVSTNSSASRPAGGDVEPSGVRGRAQDVAGHVAHHVERAAEHVGVGLQREGASAPARPCVASAAMTRYSRRMSCALGSTPPSGGRRRMTSPPGRCSR